MSVRNEAEFHLLRRYISSELGLTEADHGQLGCVDHDQLVHLALRHSVVPWLFDAVNGVELTSDARRALDRAQKVVIVRRKLEKLQSLELSSALQSADIRHVFLKGMATSERAYKATGKPRQSSDLDVLIHPSDFPKLREVSAMLGYQPENSELADGLVQCLGQHSGMIRANEIKFYAGHADKFSLDIHWRLLPRYLLPLDTDFVLESAEWLEVDGHRLPFPDAGLHFLHVCVHGLNDRFFKLSQLVDVYLLQRSQTPAVLPSKKLGAEDQVQSAIAMAQMVFSDSYNIDEGDKHAGYWAEHKKNNFLPYRYQNDTALGLIGRWHYYRHQVSLLNKRHTFVAPIVDRLRLDEMMVQSWARSGFPLVFLYPFGLVIRAVRWIIKSFSPGRNG